MIARFLKLIIAALLVLGAIYLIIDGEVTYGVLITLLAGLLVFFYFKNEKNLIALILIRKNKFQLAEKVLKSVKRPEILVDSQTGYYYYLSGLVALQMHEISKAEKLMKSSLKSGLRLKTDQAIVKLNLAGIAINKRNKKLARIYIQECKKLDSRKILTTQIKEFEALMKRA